MKSVIFLTMVGLIVLCVAEANAKPTASDDGTDSHPDPAEEMARDEEDAPEQRDDGKSKDKFNLSGVV